MVAMRGFARIPADPGEAAHPSPSQDAPGVHRDRAQWWQSLGGPNAITLAAWLITLPGGVIASLAFIPVDTSVSPWTWMLFGVVIHLAAGVVLLIARLTYLSPGSRPSRPWAAVGTVLLAGGVRGAFAWELATYFRLGSAGDLIGRVTGAAIAMLLWYSLATLLVDGSRRHRQAQARLTGELEREQALALRSATVSNEYRRALVARISARLSDELDGVRRRSDTPEVAAEGIQRLVDDVVRPLGRELERRSIEDAELLEMAERPAPAGVPFRAYVRGVFTDRPFAPWVTGLVVTVTPLFSTMAAFGPRVGGIIMSVVAVYVTGSLLVARALLAHRLPGWPTAWRAFTVLCVWTGVSSGLALGLAVLHSLNPVASDTWLLSFSPGSGSATLLVIFALAAGTMVACAADGSVEVQRIRTEQALAAAVASAEWAADRLRQTAWVEQQRLGRALHGDIQARLVSLAMRLRAGDPDGLADAIAVASSDMVAALAAERPDSWRARLEGIAAVWHDAIRLTIWIAPDSEEILDADPLAARAVVAIAGEAITNAVRHGDADLVRVEAFPDGADIIVTVVDDGIGVDPVRASPGSGSRLFDAASREWSLDTGVLTTLRARIASRAEEGMLAAS